MSPIILVIVVSFAAALGSAALTGLVCRYALRLKLIDEPNARSSHSRATPRGGGLGIAVASMLGVLVLWLLDLVDGRLLAAFVCGGLPIAAIGFVDDRWSVPPLARLMLHIAASAAAVALLGGTPQIELGSATFALGIGGSFISVLCLVWLVNLFNFMDGIDGLAASEASFVMLASAVLMMSVAGFSAPVALAMIIGGASIGFMVWNWPPARIFMGDVGSGFLGYAIGVVALSAAKSGALNAIPSLILGGVFFIDATLTVLRRAMRRERVFEAHRSHAYQQLSSRWGSHLKVTLLVLSINLLWMLPFAIWSVHHPDHAGWLLAAALLPIAIGCHVIGSGGNRRAVRVNP